MNDLSIRSVRLPQLRRNWLGADFAKSSLCAVLSRIQVGSISIYEGDEVLRFGNHEEEGAPHAEVRVHHADLYRQMLLSGSVGAGEAYMQGHWSSPDLLSVMRVFTANMAVLQSMDSRKSVLRSCGLKLFHFFNRNTQSGSRRNISAHYDLGNDFFELFLDQRMMYSSAIFPNREASLEEAATHKLDVICQQLQLQPEDHLLEVGTGWGGMAIYAATHYGCRVTTTTISKEQFDYAKVSVKEAGLEDRITVLCRDYRDLEGSYDKLVSIEMIEAVGHKFYESYFSKCSSLLKPDGLMLVQAITMADQRYDQARESVDFIQRYIFPGGCLPSIAVISEHVAHNTNMQMTNLLDITPHYADTLAHWRERFFARLEEVRAQGFDEAFERMWEYYLCYCEGGFRERVIGTVQVTFAKPGYRFP